MIYKIIGVFDALFERAMPLQCVNDMPDADIVESHRRAILLKRSLLILLLIMCFINMAHLTMRLVISF